MKVRSQLLVTLVLASMVSCEQQTPVTHLQDVRTVDNVPTRMVPVQTLPVLREEATEIKPPEPTDADGNPIKTSTALKPALKPASTPETNIPTELPFAPLIAMDPVDGTKVSIRIGTASTEYKNKLYYFSSPENKKTFLGNPEVYANGVMARY